VIPNPQGAFRAARAGWLSLLLLVASPAPPASAAGGLHFEHVGAESGPPPEVITALYQDRAGFLWIGSRDGLLRYDGYSFVVFEHDVSDPTSISDNSIRVVYEDRQGNLWIGTNSGGLDRLDRATWQFEHFRHDSSEPRSLSHDSVYSILQDRTGALWVGTQQGLNRFDPTTQDFDRFMADADEPGRISHDYVMAIYEDREGRLWIGTLGGGLNSRSSSTASFVVYRNDPSDPLTLNNDRVHALVEDAEGQLWVATATGVNLLDRKEGTFRRFEHDPRDPTSLSEPLVSALAAGSRGKLWVGTFGGGLNELDTRAGTSRVLRHDPARRNSLGDDRILCLLGSASGMLWVGTWSGGLNRVTPSSMLLSARADQVQLPESAEGGDVTGLMHDGRSGVWVGTRNGELQRLNRARGSDRCYLREDEEGTILRIVEDPAGDVWVGSSMGLLLVDPETGDTREFRHDPDDPTALGPGYVKGLLVDREGKLWVGTGEGGLQQVGRDGRVQRRFLHDPADPTSLSDNYVTALLESRGGTIWVGTRSGGLNAFDPESGRASRHVPDPADDDSISHHYVTSILEDSRGRLWVGTAGGGLNRAEVDQAADGLRFTRFTTASGLIDDDVMAILEDDDGSLWLSTKRGLSRFDPDGDAVVNFYVADGLAAAEFEPGSAARARSELYFGSVKGLVTIPAGTPFPAPTSSATVVTSIRTSAGELGGEQPVWLREHVEIPYGEWLSLELAVLDFNTEHNHAYAYRLGDEREEWVELGPRRTITFTDLSPRSYTLSVRGRNAQGVWSSASPTLQLRIVPPFWLTNWFRAVVALVVVALAVAGHQLRMSRLENRNRELLALHEQREKARGELRLAYDRLRRLTRRLEAAKEDERKHIARELHDDMGPALTAVIINLQLLAGKPDPEDSAKRISDTVELVDRLLQQVRDLSLDLRPPLLDELGLVPALKGYLEAHAERAGIRIDVDGVSAIEGLPAEIEITAFRVVQEAVTNVIRHAGATRAAVTVRRERGKLDLSVEDDGQGFDVRDTMSGPAARKALGLLGMQERVSVLGGEVEIESGPGEGTRVRVRLPVEARP
jgi:ligand-binding sensor domain-containing protein/signal transduction histidine kinase